MNRPSVALTSARRPGSLGSARGRVLGQRVHEEVDERTGLLLGGVQHGIGDATHEITPEEAPGHYGWPAQPAALDLPASSAPTRQRLNWLPTGPGLLADLRRTDYDAR